MKFKTQSAKCKVMLLFTFSFLLLTFPVHAQASGFGQSRISPASPLYFLKSVREVLELKFAGTAHVKSIRELEFAHRRLREVKSLVKTPDEGLIEPTLERYWSAWVEFNKSVNLKDEVAAAGASETAVLHMNVLQEAYGGVSATAARRSIMSTVNKLSKWDRQTIEKLNALNKYPHAQSLIVSNLSACKLLRREASSSALNEVERVVYQDRARECYGSF